MGYLEGIDGSLYWEDSQGNLHEVEEDEVIYEDEYYESGLEEAIYEKDEYHEIEKTSGNAKGLIFTILGALVLSAAWYGIVQGSIFYNLWKSDSVQTANIAQVFESASQPTEVYQQSDQPVPEKTLIPTPIHLQIISEGSDPITKANYHEVTELPPGYDFLVEVSYYNPFRGGTNCDKNGDCGNTGSGRIIDNGIAIGSYWWNQWNNYGGSACPRTFKDEQLRYKEIELLVNDEIITLICMDEGGLIYNHSVNGIPIIRVDILHDDGYRNPDDPYNHPDSRSGTQVGDRFWFAKFK